MSCVVGLFRSRFLPLASMLALSVGVAGCSGESTRFNENPFASRTGPDTTGSVGTPVQTAPVLRIESQPLPPTGQVQMAPRPAPVASNVGSYAPPPVASQPQVVASRPLAAPAVTGSVKSAPRPAGGSWTWDGGTPITVAQGDTVDSIARRHGVPPTAIMHANNITAQAALHPGQQLVIPRYVPALAAPAAAPATRPVAAAPAKPATVATAPATAGAVHVVASGETLSKISRIYGKSAGEIAKANNIRPTAPLKIGDRLTIPGVRTSSIQPNTQVASAQAKAVPPVSASTDGAAETASVASAPTYEPASASSKTVEGTGALPTFRWPANGRVIAGFGTSPNGVQNDGINLALPEGTPIKAAEDGVVAYAGNELKGYGNLVLVRHPNGYVTAYAHAKELLVKRGDPIKRGQVIARSGQTGNVNTPQLHFEIRKGASPLDPTRFLKGA